mgnify:CR=1 FL=1
MNTLHYAAPLILTGLAIAITFKANIYNMGVEGQMLLGGFFAGIVGAYLPISDPLLSKVVCFVVAILCGMLFALIPAILKAKCNVKRDGCNTDVKLCNGKNTGISDNRNF